MYVSLSLLFSLSFVLSLFSLQRDIVGSKHKEKMEKIGQKLSTDNVPADIRHRIVGFYEHKFKNVVVR